MLISAEHVQISVLIFSRCLGPGITFNRFHFSEMKL